MWIQYGKSKSNNDLIEYIRALTTKEHKKAKRKFEMKLERNFKVNPKSFYSYVGNKIRTKDKVPIER